MLIGLTGYKRSGKSTAAEYLEKEHGFIRHNFKDGLIQEIKDGFPDLLEEIGFIYKTCFMTKQELYDYLFIEKPPLMRALMQNYGTEVRRTDDPNYWVKQWEKAFIKAYPENVVVDDVRFLNEAEAMKKYGGKIIRIVRNDIQDGGSHQSESEQDDIEVDYVIKAEKGDHAHIYDKIDEIVNSLL